MTYIFHRIINSFYRHNICFNYKENDSSFQRTAVFCFFTMLQELESLTLESRLFEVFGNISFGNVSIHFNFSTCIVSFTSLSESIFQEKGSY